MKIRLAAAKPFFSIVVLIFLFGTLAAFGQSGSDFSLNTSPLPAPTSPINDYVGVFDPAAKAALEKRVIDYKTATGVELAVAVVNTTGDRPILEYSLAVARGWGIGSKADDNPSALLFVAIDDRKYFTQVSRNLEDELPDGLVGSLQRQHLVPEFRNRNYAKGISDTIEAYIRTIDAKRSGTATPTPKTVGIPGLRGSLQRQQHVPDLRNSNYAKGISDTIEACIRTINAKRSGTATPTPETVGIPGVRRESGGGVTLFCCLGIILLIVIILASSS